jgi:hypothetical protein
MLFKALTWDDVLLRSLVMDSFRQYKARGEEKALMIRKPAECKMARLAPFNSGHFIGRRVVAFKVRQEGLGRSIVVGCFPGMWV